MQILRGFWILILYIYMEEKGPRNFRMKAFRGHAECESALHRRRKEKGAC